jgi:hypothetical protein
LKTFKVDAKDQFALTDGCTFSGYCNLPLMLYLSLGQYSGIRYANLLQNTLDVSRAIS